MKFIKFTCAVAALLFSLLCPAQNATVPAQSQSQSDTRILRGLIYAKAGDAELALDLYLPPEASAKTPVPLLIWIHGGGLSEGSRRFCPLSPLAKEGFAVASISYRLVPKAILPAQVYDVKAAVRWLRAHAADHGYDGSRIGASGESAGGQLAAILGTSGDVAELEGPLGNTGVSNRVQAVAALCPPTDFTLEDTEQAEVPALLASGDSKKIIRGKTLIARNLIFTRIFGGTLEEKRDLARLMSPIAHVTPDDPPFLLIHGDKDDLVPLSQSEALRNALVAAGVEARLEVVRGAGHGFGRPKPELMQQIKDFFDRHLKDQSVKN